MNKEFDPTDHEDVVVIEQRDKKTIVYILVAALLGVAVGGLVGSYASRTKWESAYSKLEVKLEQTTKARAESVEKRLKELDQKEESIDETVSSRVENEVQEVTKAARKEAEKSREMVAELEKVNIELDQRVRAQEEEILSHKETISSLERQVGLQSNVFSRSRELFQRELLVRQDLEKLRKEREMLEPRLKRFKKECDIYLEGVSFDASSASCDKQDEVNSEISQIDQMIEVHKLDLMEIERISENIGL